MVISGWIDGKFLDKAKSFDGDNCPVCIMLKDSFPYCKIEALDWHTFSVHNTVFKLNQVAGDHMRNLSIAGMRPAQIAPFWVRLVEQK